METRDTQHHDSAHMQWKQYVIAPKIIASLCPRCVLRTLNSTELADARKAGLLDADGVRHLSHQEYLKITGQWDGLDGIVTIFTAPFDEDTRWEYFARGFRSVAGRDPVYDEDYETATLEGYKAYADCYTRGREVARRGGDGRQ